MMVPPEKPHPDPVNVDWKPLMAFIAFSMILAGLATAVALIFILDAEPAEIELEYSYQSVPLGHFLPPPCGPIRGGQEAECKERDPMPAICHFCKSHQAIDRPLHVVLARASAQGWRYLDRPAIVDKRVLACDPCIRIRDEIEHIELPRDEYNAALDLLEEAAP